MSNDNNKKFRVEDLNFTSEVNFNNYIYNSQYATPNIQETEESFYWTTAIRTVPVAEQNLDWTTSIQFTASDENQPQRNR
ncbi:MAG: hypothetical protein ACK4OM_00225 [Alphaproteobacteria bacterium]